MLSLRIHFWSIAATLIAFVASLWINQEVFAHTSFVRGINWIFLPSGIRLLSTLLVGADGFLGLLLAGLLTDFLYWFPHDPVRAIAGAILGSAAPYLVYRFAREYYGLRASLTNLTPVTGRRNRAGDGRRNGASRNGGKAQIRTASRMPFFARFGNRVFTARRHRFGLAEALALDHDAIGAVA